MAEDPQPQTIAPPEGYTLVKKADFEACQEHMKSLTRAVNSLKESMNLELERHIIKAMREQKHDGNPKLAVESLSKKFADECENSTLKSALVTSRSEFKKQILMEFSKGLSKKISTVQKDAQQQMEKEVESAAENIRKSLRESTVITEEIRNAVVMKYRNTVQQELLTGMTNIYQNHCKDLYNHLHHHFGQLQQQQPNGGSLEIRQRMDAIMNRVAALERGASLEIMDPNFEERVNSHLNDIMNLKRNSSDEEDTQAKITTLIRQCNYQGAVYEALCATDITVLLETCRMIDPEQLFAIRPPSRETLLCLVHQMTEDLHEETDLKLEYIGRSAMVFQKVIREGHADEELRGQMSMVLRPLLIAIDERIPRNSTARMLKLAVQSILDQI